MTYPSDTRLREEIDAMAGEGFLFSRFPTETVRANMQLGGVKASSGEVERLWLSYQRATVESGLAPYSKHGGGAVSAPLLAFMSKETGYPKMTVAAFLNGLEKAVKEGWDWKWIDPRAAAEEGLPMTVGDSISQAVKGAGDTVGAFLKPTLDPVTNLVKYAAIAIVAGAVVYGVYQGTQAYKAYKRVRRRR